MPLASATLLRCPSWSTVTTAVVAASCLSHTIDQIIIWQRNRLPSTSIPLQVLIENTLKEELPAVSQAVVVGDRRKFLTVLLALRCTVDAAGAPTENLDGPALASLKAAGCTATTVAAAAACPAFAAYVSAGIARANGRAISRACALHKWRLLPRDLSVAGGELTATLKLKRGEILKLYGGLVEAMYAEGAAAE